MLFIDLNFAAILSKYVFSISFTRPTIHLSGISKFSANPRLQTKRVTLLEVKEINPERN